jgi:ribonuclease R
MKERVGDVYPGKVSGVAPFGLFITLDELYVEGLLHVSELGNEYFQYNEASQELRGERTGRRFRLGHEVLVQVSRVDLEARRIEFGIRGLGRGRSQPNMPADADAEPLPYPEDLLRKRRSGGKTTRARPPRKARLSSQRN